MNLTPQKRKKLTWWIIGIAAACTLIFVGLQNIDSVANAVKWCAGLIMPLLLGFAFALILNVPMRFFESHLWSKTKKPLLCKLRRPLSFLISLVLIIGILTGVIRLVISKTYADIHQRQQRLFVFARKRDCVPFLQPILYFPTLLLWPVHAGQDFRWMILSSILHTKIPIIVSLIPTITVTF